MAQSNPNILNSKSEWNNSALPRLVTRTGSLEQDLKNCEKELNAEKSAEKEFEDKVRELRKNRNKARLITEKNPPPKRQKIEEGSYISIRKTWGPPPPCAPKKNPPMGDENPKAKKIRSSSAKPDQLAAVQDHPSTMVTPGLKNTILRNKILEQKKLIT